MDQENLGFLDFFKSVPDHRINRKKLYPIEEILLLSFCGMIVGARSWDDLELFGEIKLPYLRRFLRFENGTPSDDTLRRFFRALDPEVFEYCLINWVKSFQMELEKKIVAVDGKTACGSFDGEGRPIHLVNAFASEIGIVLGQVKTADKSNEITAIPQLLEILDIAGAIVTIDAMGCQSKVVEKIIEKKADYVISLKGNQETLHEDVRFLFEQKPKNVTFHADSQSEKGHGRLETRTCTVTEEIDWLREQHPQWKNLRSVVEIESCREIKGIKSIEKRYYISSLPADPAVLMNAVRQHWGIENKLHWVLDVCFGEDQSRIRKGNAPRNMAIVRKTALNLLQIVKKTMPRMPINRMKKLAGWDESFLDTVLMAKF